MTAARSDLMALKNEADRIVKCGVTDFPVYQAIELLEEVSGTIDHLAAASQPDREAVKEFIASASFASRSSLDSDTIFCEIYTPGYQPAKKGSFGFFVKELRAILSLLSGASTKSDGGPRGQPFALTDAVRECPAPRLSSGKQEGRTGSEVGASQIAGSSMSYGLARPIVAEQAPGPSDPSPGPDVSATKEAQLCERRKGEPPAIFSKHEERNGTTPTAVGPDVREALEESSQTLEYLRREARAWGKIFSVNVDHVLDKNRKDLSALTRPLGGFVQGSIATKRSSDPEGSSRTETAIATMLCKSGKFETGEGTCAFVCMGRLGDVRKDGCSHAKRVHAKLAATIAECLRAECGYDHGYADGVEWATCHAAVAETNAAAPGNTGLVSGVSSEPPSPDNAKTGGAS